MALFMVLSAYEQKRRFTRLLNLRDQVTVKTLDILVDISTARIDILRSRHVGRIEGVSLGTHFSGRNVDKRLNRRKERENFGRKRQK